MVPMRLAQSPCGHRSCHPTITLFARTLSCSSSDVSSLPDDAMLAMALKAAKSEGTQTHRGDREREGGCCLGLGCVISGMLHANACWQVRVQRAANVSIILKLCHICCVPCRQGRLAATVAGGASEDLADQLRLHPPAAADRRGQLRKVWRSGCLRFCLSNSWGAFSSHANAGACFSVDLAVCNVSYLGLQQLLSRQCPTHAFTHLAHSCRVYVGTWQGTQVAVKILLGAALDLYNKEAVTQALTLSNPVLSNLSKVGWRTAACRRTCYVPCSCAACVSVYMPSHSLPLLLTRCSQEAGLMAALRWAGAPRREAMSSSSPQLPASSTAQRCSKRPGFVHWTPV